MSEAYDKMVLQMTVGYVLELSWYYNTNYFICQSHPAVTYIVLAKAELHDGKNPQYM